MDCLQLSCETNISSESTCVQPTTTSSIRDWAGLLPELLGIIVQKLGRLLDYIRFCGVCPQWRLVALRSDVRHQKRFIILKASRKKIPMLVMKTEEHNDDTRGLYSISDGITYDIKLPQPCKYRFFGSSHGWLMCFDENSFDEIKAIMLLNPLNNSCICLPVFKNSINYVNWSRCPPGYFLRKGIISADPLVSPNYMVVIIYSDRNRLAVYEAGDRHWKFLDVQPERNYSFCDVAFYKSNLYGFTFDSKLVKIDTGCLSGKTIIPEDGTCVADFAYLVESQGELLLVKRYWNVEDEIYNYEEADDRNSFRTETLTFRVFKLAHEKESTKWVRVSNIVEQALFVGDNHSLSISTLGFSECLSNEIYYNSQYHLYMPPYTSGGPDEDSGFFDLEDESFHLHHRLDLCERYMEPPIWFVPNPDFYGLE